jgi:2-haloalkanoic acid dehalogenase type II
MAAVKREGMMIKLPKAIVFDNFGTIIDWETDIATFFGRILAREGVGDVDTREVQRYWEERQFAYIQGEYKPYRQILKDTLPMAFEHYGFKFTDEDLEAFAASMAEWKPFPDSHDALLEIKKYCKIVLQTNTDNDLIQGSLKRIGVEFDDVVTGEMVGAYKPDPKGFNMTRDRLGLTEDDILHAGFGYYYDIVPSTKLGYKTCWVNRQGIKRPGDIKETILCGDLKTLSLIIKGLVAEVAGK